MQASGSACREEHVDSLPGPHLLQGSQSWGGRARSPGDILPSSVSGHLQTVTKCLPLYLLHLAGVVNSYTCLCALGPHPPPQCGHQHLPACSLPQRPVWPPLSSLYIATGMIFPMQECGLSPAKTFIAFPLPHLPLGPRFSKLSPDPCLPPCPPHTPATGTCRVPSASGRMCLPSL